jgi:hypothetical protein
VVAPISRRHRTVSDPLETRRTASAMRFTILEPGGG